MTDLRYPVGKFPFERNDYSDADRAAAIEDIASLPQKLRDAVAGLTEEQLDTPYRPEGWTIRQVIHHVADSHVNSYIRFKLALTEHEPTIKPYAEALWAEFPDGKSFPVEISLQLLDALHARLVNLLKTRSPEDFDRTLLHPEMGPLNLHKMTALYGWHSRHHLAHITSLKERLGWQ